MATISGASRATPETELIVGREPELALLDRFVARLGQNIGGVVGIAGEAGIGKSILLSAVRRNAESRGFVALEGRGTEYERDVPFALLVDALDGQLPSINQGRLDALGDDPLAELTSIFPSLAGRDAPLSSELAAERYRAHVALRAAIERLAAEKPVVLILDDLHWADEASAEFVCYLLRHPPGNAVLIMLAYRPGSEHRLLKDTIAAAAQKRGLVELALGPLSPSAADALLDKSLRPSIRCDVFRDSGGNPFYLLELGRAASRRELAFRANSAAGRPLTDPVPTSVVAALREELSQLSPNAAVLLRGAAVAGEPFEFQLAVKIAELSDSEAEIALDEVLAYDLLRQTDTPLRLRFRHPIVRHAVYDSAGEGWRIMAHGRAAAALESRGASIAVRAHHLERSARWGDEHAISVLTEAANAAAPRAPAAAAAWFSAALRLLPTGTPLERRLSLLVSRAVALGSTGRVAEARAALMEALPLVPEESAVERAWLVGTIARIDHMVGRCGDARSLLSDALARLEGSRSKGAVALRLELAMDYWQTPDWEQMRATAQTAHEEACIVGDPTLTTTAAAIFALATYYCGETGSAEELISGAAVEVDRLSDEALATRIDALVCLGHAEWGMERFAAAAGHLERGIAIARRTGQSLWFGRLKCALGLVELSRGRLTVAERAAEDAHEAAMLGGREPLIRALALRCWIAVARGQVDRALRLGKQACELETSKSFTLSWLHWCLGVALLESGDPESAAAEILGHAGGPSLAAIERSWRPRWFELLAAVELARDRPDAAERWVHEAERSAAELRISGRLAEASRARAALELARGHALAAKGAARAASARFARVGSPVEEARAQIILARSLVSLGENECAEKELVAAHATLDSRGALRARDEAARDLRRLGRRVARGSTNGQPPSDHGALTSRELEVAELVARGRSNREIADSLFLSHKTVETHMTHIFEKLGVPSRSAVASAVERQRLSA